MAGTDSDYFRKRAEEEIRLAGDAECPQVASAHLELARLYEARARNASSWDDASVRNLRSA